MAAGYSRTIATVVVAWPRLTTDQIASKSLGSFCGRRAPPSWRRVRPQLELVLLLLPLLGHRRDLCSEVGFVALLDEGQLSEAPVVERLPATHSGHVLNLLAKVKR